MGQPQQRREFLRGVLLGGAAFAVTGCGGGSSSSGGTAGTAAVPPAPSAPAPTAAPPPPPVPTLKGVTIEQAEADIRATVQPYVAWFAAARTPEPIVTVASADQLQAAIDTIYKSPLGVAALARNYRIECAWNGDSTMAAGPIGRVVVGASQLETSFYDQGGSLVIAAAPGYKPGIANTMFIATRGVTLRGLGFTRRAQAGENQHSVAAVFIQTTAKFQPLKAIAQFENCSFGTFEPVANHAIEQWVDGVKTSGGETEYVGFTGCSFCGMSSALKLISRHAVVSNCDFRQCLGDGVDLFGHIWASDYHCNAVIEKSTFRNWSETWETRDFHCDAIQTGTATDIHKGYRVLVTDNVAHMVRRYGGSEGKGGGPQGFHNAATPNADNQFVLRRSTFLVSAWLGFTYYSPNASRPSFVDRCTFMRAGMIPSAFAPDTTLQDNFVTVASVGAEPVGSPWLLVTDTFAKHALKPTVAAATITEVDPRLPAAAPEPQRPESVFVGRDFGRGNAVVNGQPGKFGYTLPAENGSRSQFVSDVWANFQPRAGGTLGAPDLRHLAWTG